MSLTVRSLDRQSDPLFWDTLELYVETFPRDEREPLSRVAAVASGELTNGPVFRVAELGGELAGFTYSMHSEMQGFLIYIAVTPDLRGQGTGAALLVDLRQSQSGPCLLECELPSLATGTERLVRERRIEFFIRHGAQIVSESYVQPALGPGRAPVPLILLALGVVPDPARAVRHHYTEFFGLNEDAPEIAQTLNGLRLR